MLRELQTKTGKVYDTMNTASEDMVVGMGVVKEYGDGKVSFPDSATDKGIYFVTKEKRAEGVYAGLGEISDYDDMFMNIKNGEGVKLVSPEKGERYATDQFTAGATKGEHLNVGTDGKFVKDDNGTSRFVYCGTKTIDRHELHVIEVVD